MAEMINIGPLIGMRIVLRAESGPYRPCRRCRDGSMGVIGFGTAMHIAKLECEGCGRFTNWIPKDHVVLLLGSLDNG